MISHQRVTNLFDLMDAAYDVPQIHAVSRQLGHIPLIDQNPRRNKILKDEILAENKRKRIIGHQLPESHKISRAQYCWTRECTVER